METLKKRLEEQKARHQGGNKWIGTAGTSPFGAYGYNPEGIRIGQSESRHKRAIKVWDKREFKNFDSDIELGTRGMKIALKRLRKWARDGADEELRKEEEKQKRIEEEREIALKQKAEEEERIREENRRIKEWEDKFDQEQKKKEEALIQKFYSDQSTSNEPLTNKENIEDKDEEKND